MLEPATSAIVRLGDEYHIPTVEKVLETRTSIAQKMSWAARRKTTRIEDQAYSLMGLFQVNMPLLYGEETKHSAGCRRKS